MRIVSLLPSATEIVYALGLGESVVGVTHECDYPPQARAKPAVTGSVLDQRAASATLIGWLPGASTIIAASIPSTSRLLRDMGPDLILTQELCAVCAVSYAEVQRAARILPGDTPIVSLEPHTLGDILATITLVGSLTGRAEAAARLVTDLEARIATVAARAGQAASRPRVYCMEWIDPPFRAGHWIPEMVRLAGGVEVLGHEGVRSTRATWPEVTAAAPEVVVVMPCGFDVARTAQELPAVQERPEWTGLPAVAEGRVWITDGSAYFSRPGPRIVEVLAHALHPTLFPTPSAQDLRLLRAPASAI